MFSLNLPIMDIKTLLKKDMKTNLKNGVMKQS
jgi:hypothetical protein